MGNRDCPQTQAPLWQFIGHSVRGATHIRADKPNQDAIAWLPRPPEPTEQAKDGPTQVVEGLPLIAAIADGHGGERYVHSDRGAQFAVEVAVALLDEFVRKYAEASPTATKHAAQQLLPDLIVRKWKERVDADIEAPETLVLADTADAPDAANVAPLPDQSRYVLYGATVLAAAITGSYILYLQLGDGDILTVTPDGAIGRPIAKDESLIANETTSLCLPGARDFFRIEFQVLLDLSPEQMPSLIMLSTDGYSNSFASDDDFLSVAKDYWDMARQHGLDRVQGRLKQWLEETSKGGSGDDITVGMIRRMEERDPAWASKQINAINTGLQDTQRELANGEARLAQLGDSLTLVSKQHEELARRTIFLQWCLTGCIVLLLTAATLAGVGYSRLLVAVNTKVADIERGLTNQVSKPAVDPSHKAPIEPRGPGVTSGLSAGGPNARAPTESSSDKSLKDSGTESNKSKEQKHRVRDNSDAQP